MEIKTVKLKGGFYHGQHIKINVETDNFAMLKAKDIPRKFADQGAKPNPEERCDYLNVWYKRVDDKNFEFNKETEVDGDENSPAVESKPYPKDKVKVETKQMIELKGGRFDGDMIPNPETDIVDIPGHIFISDNDWQEHDGEFFCVNDRIPKVPWTEEDKGIILQHLVKFVYKKFDKHIFKFSHVEA